MTLGNSVPVLSLFIWFYSFVTTAHAFELQPFEWHYDVVYTNKERAYNGRGTYRLIRKENDIWSFSLSIKTHNGILSSVDEVLLHADSRQVVTPIERKRQTSFMGVPIKKKIALDLNNDSPYESLSALLRLLYDLRFSDAIPRQWRLWLADEKKYQEFSLAKEGPLYIKGRTIDSYLIEKQEEKNDKSFLIWIAKKENRVIKVVRKNGKETIQMEAANLLEYNQETSHIYENINDSALLHDNFILFTYHGG